MCPHTSDMCLKLLVYETSSFRPHTSDMCPHTTIHVTSYNYICVPVLLTTCVLIVLYMCPHTTTCVLVFRRGLGCLYYYTASSLYYIQAMRLYYYTGPQAVRE
jgi:hypothetical protein